MVICSKSERTQPFEENRLQQFSFVKNHLIFFSSFFFVQLYSHSFLVTQQTIKTSNLFRKIDQTDEELEKVENLKTVKFSGELFWKNLNM